MQVRGDHMWLLMNRRLNALGKKVGRWVNLCHSKTLCLWLCQKMELSASRYAHINEARRHRGQCQGKSVDRSYWVDGWVRPSPLRWSGFTWVRWKQSHIKFAARRGRVSAHRHARWNPQKEISSIRYFICRTMIWTIFALFIDNDQLINRPMHFLLSQCSDLVLAVALLNRLVVGWAGQSRQTWGGVSVVSVVWQLCCQEM